MDVDLASISISYSLMMKFGPGILVVQKIHSLNVPVDEEADSGEKKIEVGFGLQV